MSVDSVPANSGYPHTSRFPGRQPASACRAYGVAQSLTDAIRKGKR